MGGEGIPGSLTKQYKKLKNQSFLYNCGSREATENDRALDAIYWKIINSPVTDLGSVLDKLSFAHLCLTDEEDPKEAAKLLLQVCNALEGSMVEPRCVHLVPRGTPPSLLGWQWRRRLNTEESDTAEGWRPSCP
jgi:hypothetical protein